MKRLAASRGNNEHTWAAVIRFTDRDGQEQQFTKSVRTNPPRFAPGAKVPAPYDPQNLASAAVAGYWGRFGALTIVADANSAYWPIRQSRNAISSICRLVSMRPASADAGAGRLAVA